MSGRSAHVRKKITEPRVTEKGLPLGRGRSKSGSARLSTDDNSAYEYPLPQTTGFGTTNARLLKFSDSAYDVDFGHYRSELANRDHASDGSQSGSSGNDRQEGGVSSQGPMPPYAYAKARKPVLKTEDLSGIERSGFRSAVDRHSDGIRKGLTKAFTLGLKKKKENQVFDRAPSSATIRHPHYDPEDYDTGDMPAMPTHRLFGSVGDHDHQPIASTPPSARLPPVPASTAPPIKRWIGAGRPVQRWNKLRKDPELWDPHGDVLIYFGRKDQPQRPNPSFRLSSHIIEATESRLLVTLLREGSTEDDYNHINLPPSPIGAPPMLLHSSYLQANQATPPISEDNAHADLDGQISYEMYFPTPPSLTKAEAHRYAITTRNLFALLYHTSLVGLSLFQALHDLLGRLNEYMEPDADNLGTILKYLSARGIDDARNDVETAVSMLAWSETPEVRWEEGWREAFLHCTGMYARLESCADFRHLTPITRALLERASLETQLRVRAAEDRLVTFAFADAWGSVAGSSISSGAGKAVAERLQQFFIGHYTKVYGMWPPPDESGRGGYGRTAIDGEDIWLTRTVAQVLQRDFGALYDYLVNRDIVWDESEMRSSRKWMMVSESGNKSFDADTDDLPLTDILIEFDNRFRFPHIPHPYPLIPESIPPTTSPSTFMAQPNSSRERTKKDKSARLADDRTLERRIQLAYTEATNIYNLGSDFAPSDLVDGFVRFEKMDHQLGAVDPACARRWRWVLIYAVLQTLASVSVDAPNARYKDGVSYHLSPRLRGTRAPPWKSISPSSSALEASHELSHCWVVPRTWLQAAPPMVIDAAELSDTSTSAGTADPLLRMMRNQGQKFPRPPASTASRSSLAGGWQSPSAYSSARSTNTATPTMWGGSSAMSVSGFSDDTATTSGGRMLSPSSYSQYSSRGLPRLPPPPRSGGNDEKSNSSARSERSVTTFGPGANATRSGLHSNHSSSNNLHAHYNLIPSPTRGDGQGMQWPVRSQSIYRSQPPSPLDLSVGVTGKGHFFHEMGYAPGTGHSGAEGRHGLLPGLSPLSSSEGLVAPVIRDFDELDSVAEEASAAHEKMI